MLGRLHEIMNMKVNARGYYTISFGFDIEPGSQA
jgi:hypothetical protein